MTYVRLPRAAWRKSSYSGGNGDCIEVARCPAASIAVRDSKDPQGPSVMLTAENWRVFARQLKEADRY